MPWIQEKLKKHCTCAPKIGIQNDSSDKSDKQIVNGLYTTPNPYPWVVGAYFFKKIDMFKCSGALISKKHVLMPADHSQDFIRMHKRGYSIRVRLGSNVNTMKRGVSGIYVHENYKRGLDFSIALWELDREVAFGYNIQPIRLPSTSFADYTGKMATVTGWYDNDSNSSLVSKLQETHVPILIKNECADHLDLEGKFTNNMICTGKYENGVNPDCSDDVRSFDRNISIVI